MYNLYKDILKFNLELQNNDATIHMLNIMYENHSIVYI